MCVAQVKTSLGILKEQIEIIKLHIDLLIHFELYFSKSLNRCWKIAFQKDKTKY